MNTFINRKRKNLRPALILLNDTESTDIPRCNVINSSEFIIGRSEESNLQLLIPSISRHHCSLLFDDQKNKWSLVSHCKRAIYVQNKDVKKNESMCIECGDEIRLTPFLAFSFKCAPDSQWKCCSDIKKVKLSNTVEKENVENVIIIDDDDDDDDPEKATPVSQLPDSSSKDDDIYLNPTPSCSGVILSARSKIDSPLTIDDIKAEIDNLGACRQLKEDLEQRFDFLKNLKKYNATCELYFCDPAENFAMSAAINEFARYFEEIYTKCCDSKLLSAKSDPNLNKIILKIDAILMSQTQLAMSFLRKFLQPALYRAPENTTEKLTKFKANEKENDTMKEEMEKLIKENLEMKKKISNFEIMERKYRILVEEEKLREDKGSKDELQKTITTLEEQINVLNYDNSQLLNDICSAADEIAKLKDKCDSLEKKANAATAPSTSAASLYYGTYAGFIPPPLSMQTSLPIHTSLPMSPMSPMPSIPIPMMTMSSTPPPPTNKLDSISTMPFEILRFLFKSSPINSEGGVSLRRSMLDHGVIEMLLSCLAIFARQPDTNLSNSSIPEMMSILNGIKKATTIPTMTLGTSGVPSKKARKCGAKNFYQYWAKGTGYGTGDTSQSWDAQEAMRRKKLEEENITALLLVIAAYINPDRLLNSNFDIIQIGELNFADDEQPVLPAEFIALVEKSSLLPVLSSYLRNDSVLDMARHIPLYRAVMVLLRVLAFNSQLVKFFLPPDCFDGTSSSTNVPSSLIEPLEKMKASVDTYSSTLLKNRSTESIIQSSSSQPNGEGEEFNSLIADIQATAIFVEMNTERVTTRTVPNVPQIKAVCSTEDVYLREMKKLQFDSFDIIVESPDGIGIKFAVSHHFSKRIRLDGDRRHPAKMKRLLQEAATLTNALPLSFSSSVFVRNDTQRLDVMKVLIIGPAETPYMNGCFEFDVYFPPNYPNEPMLINLETTGRHSVRFNPNLYNEGKVCLSILNTWGGRPEEKWNAQTSSFLQVLVSIQSLIFVPDPYFNEPGYERSRGTAAGNRSSKDYNANIRHATVQWAMLEQLRNPSPCFKTIIQKHFFLKKDEILKQVSGWLKEAETGPNLRTHVQSLKGELIKLELIQNHGEETTSNL